MTACCYTDANGTSCKCRARQDTADALERLRAEKDALEKALRIMGIDPEKVLQERDSGNG